MSLLVYGPDSRTYFFNGGNVHHIRHSIDHEVIGNYLLFDCRSRIRIFDLEKSIEIRPINHCGTFIDNAVYYQNGDSVYKYIPTPGVIHDSKESKESKKVTDVPKGYLICGRRLGHIVLINFKINKVALMNASGEIIMDLPGRTFTYNGDLITVSDQISMLRMFSVSQKKVLWESEYSFGHHEILSETKLRAFNCSIATTDDGEYCEHWDLWTWDGSELIESGNELIEHLREKFQFFNWTVIKPNEPTVQPTKGHFD